MFLDKLDELGFYPIAVFKHCYFRTYLVLLYSVSAVLQMKVYVCLRGLFGFLLKQNAKIEVKHY